MLCETCADPYCEVCFAAQHRKGSRKQHTVKPLASKKGVKVKVNGGDSAAAKVSANGEPVSDDGILDVVLYERISCLDER